MSGGVIVIGAGITGVAAAEWLRRDGHEVTLIDRIEPGSPDQASYGNAGLLARSAILPVSEPGLLLKAPRMLLDPESPLFLRWSYLPRLMPWLLPFLRNSSPARTRKIVAAIDPLTHDSVDQHLALARGTGAEGYLRQGDYAFLYRDRRAFEKDAFATGMRRQYGFTHSEREGAALDPMLGPDYRFAAVYPDHGWITDPGGYVAALARHFEHAGGRFLKGEVADIDNGGVTLADGSRLKADRVVLAAGIGSGALARRLGIRPGLESERGYHLMLRGVNHMPAHPFMVADAKFVVTPMRDGLRCAGIVEFGGTSAPASAAPVRLLRKRIREVYPALRWQGEESWMGHRPSTPDSLPLLGPAPGAPNVLCAFGPQHVGLTVGPRLGRMVADMIAGRRANIALAPYAPGRFLSRPRRD